MNRLDVSKVLFYAISFTGLLGLSFAFGLYSAAYKSVVYETIRAVKNRVEESLNLVSEEASTLTKIHPKHFLRPARYDGSGVTVNNVSDGEDRLILLASFFDGTNQIRLIQRNGTVIARWPVSFSDIFPDTSYLIKPPKTDWNIDINCALALPDGSVVFNFEHGGLVKLDRCGNVVWTLKRQTHHSLEFAEGGGFWVPGRRYHSKESSSPFSPFKTPFEEDTILKVSEDGEVLTEISVPKLFYDEGLEALLTLGRHETMTIGGHREIFHFNKVAELSSDIANQFPMFEAGDLLLSFRERNLILVVDPHTGKIKWWRIGPWLRQHDPEFKPGGSITVFNNNSYSSSLFGANVEDECKGLIPCISNIVEIDPVSGNNRIIYGNTKGQEMFTHIKGRHKLTQNGGLFVAEFGGGRVFETDAAGRIIWEYINRYDSDEVAGITDARIYPASYFSVSDWSCE